LCLHASNCIEWAPTIKEENERAPLLDQLARKFGASSSSSRSEEVSDVSKTGATEAVRGGKKIFIFIEMIKQNVFTSHHF
jgi:hypothetical protein